MTSITRGPMSSKHVGSVLLHKLQTWQICTAVKWMNTLKFLQITGCPLTQNVPLHSHRIVKIACEAKVSCKKSVWCPALLVSSRLWAQKAKGSVFLSRSMPLDLSQWPSLAFVRETGGQFRVNLCVTKPKEAPSKWVRGSESWEKEFELCFTSGARSWGFVWEVPPACAAWHISGGERRQGTGQGD